MKKVITLFCSLFVLIATGQQTKSGEVLPYPKQEFKGKIGVSFEDSKEDYLNLLKLQMELQMFC